MNKYRRIEINAYRRRVTVVSGQWRPGDLFDGRPVQTDQGVSLNDLDSCEPVAPDSPEGQLLIVEAVRTLEERLTPETRATISIAQETLSLNPSSRNVLFLKLQSLYQFIWPKAFRFVRKEK